MVVNEQLGKLLAFLEGNENEEETGRDRKRKRVRKRRRVSKVTNKVGCVVVSTIILFCLSPSLFI